MTQVAERIKHEGLRSKIMTAEQAAEFVQNGMNVAVTGFTGAGYPKALPTAITEISQTPNAGKCSVAVRRRGISFVVERETAQIIS